MSEASSNLARFDGLRYSLRLGADQDWHTTFSDIRAAGFGPEVKRRVLLGTYALSAGYYGRYYLKALKVRTLIKEDFERALSVGGADLPRDPHHALPGLQDRREDRGSALALHGRRLHRSHFFLRPHKMLLFQDFLNFLELIF